MVSQVGASLSILVMVVSWIDIDQLAVVIAGLLILVAAVHFVMAFGLRGGLLVWSGDYPRRLPPELRRRSLGFGLLLLLASWLLAELAGLDTVPDRWDRSVGLVLIAFLGVTGLYTVARNNRWERYLFGADPDFRRVSDRTTRFRAVDRFLRDTRSESSASVGPSRIGSTVDV